MDAKFWLDCWQNNHLGFQLEAPHPMLVSALKYLPKVKQIFVPLCGKSPDLHFLADHFEVIGAELAEIACRDFFVEANLKPVITSGGAHSIYQAEQYTLWQGDFFSLPAEFFADIKLLYDRAALIALPNDLRQRYVRKLRQHLPSATLLFISVSYPQHEKVGPPFSVDETEIKQLFAGARIELLMEQDLTEVGFARRRFQTSSLIESCWLIQW